MTEIPEHLLRRSRERRAALGGETALGGVTPGGEAGAAAAVATISDAPGSSPPVPASAAAPAPPAARATPEPEVPAGPRLGSTRFKTPAWIMPVLVALPLWGIVYLGAFGNRTKLAANDPVLVGAGLYASNCASCHGGNGEGGVGPALNGGQVLKVWPKLADHISWVKTGGGPFVGKTIGATNVPVPANNVMPAFGTANGGSLSDAQIAAVVCFERVSMGNGPQTPANCPAPG